MNTINAKIGNFPGRIQDFMLEEGTTVRDALELANITIGEEQDIKMDGRVVSMDSIVTDGATLLVTKRLKGAY